MKKEKVWGKMQEEKTWTFPTKREHTRAFNTRKEETRERREKKTRINSKNAPSALERHRSQI